MPFSSLAIWIKELPGYAGIDITIFKAHSMRSATMSKAQLFEISTKDILKKRQLVREVYWQDSSTAISK